MTFNIQEFRANISPKGLSKRSHYSVLITGPSVLQGLSDERDMTFRCDAVTEPGRNIMITQDPTHYGLPLARAWGSSFSEINMSFLCSEDNTEKMYFQRWQDLMIGPYRAGATGANMYDIQYVNSYIGTIKIYKYSETGDITYSMTLKNAFPLVVSDIELGWEENVVNRLAVRFYFQYYLDQSETENTTTPPLVNGGPGL